MKLNKIISLFVGASALLFLACEPTIADSEELMNTTNIDGVELVAKQSSPGGNNIELSMVTPGVTGYWDYNTGQAFTDKVEFVYPIPGTATFTFQGTLGAEFFTKTIDVQIDVLDTPIAQDYYDLVSNNTSTGKTWVYNTAGPYWYMVAPGNKDGWAGIWWDASDCCTPDKNGKMVFDLNGAANCTYYNDANATPKLGGFSLDVDNQTLAFTDPTAMLGYEPVRSTADGIYEIVSLTEDELILYAPNNGGGTGWTFVYKPE